MYKINKFNFPKEFAFGVADADLQVMGEELLINKEKSLRTAWGNFGKEVLNKPINQAIDRFSLWEADLEWIKKLGVKHYRVSVSMSRVLNADGTPNHLAIEWYKKYFESLSKEGIKIYVTLYHWEMPHYFQEKGGWENDAILDLIEKHAITVYEYLNEYIEEYFVINEPWCISMLGNFIGLHAPGNKDFSKALKVAHNVLRAVGRVERALHKLNSQVKLSTVNIMFPIYGWTNSAEDLKAAKLANEYYNQWYLDPLFLGRYPENFANKMSQFMPKFSLEEMREMMVGDKLHALGVNFYNGDYVKASSSQFLGFERMFPEGSLRNDLDWPISLPPFYSESLYDALNQTYFSYKNHGLNRLYVSENGMPQYTPKGESEEVIADDRRIFYLSEHLKQVEKAINAGVPVAGYFLWTLMDNYEWQYGYVPESAFGVVHVDRNTMVRTAKKSFFWYQKMIESTRNS